MPPCYCAAVLKMVDFAELIRLLAQDADPPMSSILSTTRSTGTGHQTTTYLPKYLDTC